MTEEQLALLKAVANALIGDPGELNWNDYYKVEVFLALAALSRSED